MSSLERKDEWKTPKVSTTREYGPDAEKFPRGTVRDYDTLKLSLHLVRGVPAGSSDCINFSLRCLGTFNKYYYAVAEHQERIDEYKRFLLRQVIVQATDQLAALGDTP